MANSSARVVCVAATQQSCSWDQNKNVEQAEAHVRAAAAAGAQIILLQELFEAPYFCQEQTSKHFQLAKPFQDHHLIKRFSAIAAELEVVLPISYFERCNNAFYNSLAVIDADGSTVSRYRKSHIPDGPGYQEKWYFTPGDSGFVVSKTRYATIGCLICWDQWFPEAARSLALQGAEILFYPTAIGSEPQDASLNSYGHWCRVMQGHSGANLIPIVASNRIGVEEFEARPEKTASKIRFHGGSFITDYTGAIVQQVGRSNKDSPFPELNPENRPGFVTQTCNLDDIAEARYSWGLFRDRRPDLYGALLTKDGITR